MVWPTERRGLLLEHIELLKALLRQDQMSSKHWLDLLASMHEISAPLEDQWWALAHVIELRDWDRGSQHSQIHYCVRLRAQMPKSLLKMCDELLINFPWNNKITQHANRMKLNPRHLTRVLNTLGLEEYKRES